MPSFQSLLSASLSTSPTRSTARWYMVSRGGKVVQCPNGNTFLFSFMAKDGIGVSVYDPSRKRIATQTLTGGEVWDTRIMKKSSACAIYPMGEQVVVFLQQLDERAPMLYRIILSNQDGSLVKEEKIAEMPAYGGGAGYAMACGHVQPKSFYVEHDPATGAYAVLAFDGFAEETAKRIEVIHFDANHSEIGRAFYDAAETRYKYINYLGMTVDGTKSVTLATYAFNTNASGGAGSRVLISGLSGKTMTHHPLEFTRDLKDTKAILAYNPVNKVLELLTLSEVSAKGSAFEGHRTTYYSALLVSIDPQTYAVISNKPAMTMMATNYRKSHYDKEEERYSGLPMNLVINPDGTTTVVMEDESYTTASKSGVAAFIPNKPGIGMSSMNAAQIKEAQLQDIAITDYDGQWTEKNGYVVRKSQRLGFLIPPLAHHDMRNNRVTFDAQRGFGGWANSGFYSFDYVSTPSGRYVFFNDHPKNFERDAEKNPKTLTGVSDANTICYRLKDGVMTKQYFFGEPDDSFSNRLALITSGDYSEATGDYATMLIEKTGRREKAARIAWMHLK